MIASVQSTQNPVEWPYIEFDLQGRAGIAETRIRVSHLIQEKQAHGWSAEEIQFQHPELSLAQIYSALSYYYAHQESVDREIAAQKEAINRLKEELKASGAGYDAKDFRTLLETKTEEA